MVWKAVLRGMPTGPNVHGVPPPERCTVWGVDGEALQVATGDIRKAPFERSLLIASRDFDQLIATTVCQSGTLKAWFAYRVSTRHPGEKKLKSAHFAPVWAMIQESAADWAEQYDRCSDRAEMWELGQPTSILELQARVLYVLYRQVQDNPDGDLQRGLWLKWHPYYYEDVGKYLVLHRFLQYLVKHTGEGRSMDIYRRPSLGVQEHMRRAPFEETYGYQVHQMSQMFIENNAWDPKSLTGVAETDGEEPEDSTQDTEYVKFILAGDQEDQSFEIAKSTILQGNGDGQTLCDFLHSLLEWPKGYVKINGVSVDNARDNDATPVNTLDELRHFVDSERTVFQLRVAGQAAFQPTPVVPKEYINHWIFKLESLTNELSPSGAKEARPRFDLIRQGNRHSAEFVDELQKLFAPLRAQIPQHLQECAKLKELCEKARADSARAFDLRAHFGVLSEKQQAHAKQNLELIRSKHPLAGHAQALLVDMFTPRVNELAKVLEMEKVFDEVGRNSSLD